MKFLAHDIYQDHNKERRMKNRRYKPLIGMTFWAILVITLILLTAATVCASFDFLALCIVIPVDIFTLYFIVTPLFGYVELREESVFIRFGLIVTREVRYDSIREIVKDHKLYANSMMALKNSLDHVDIKYNRFDVYSVSVVDNDSFIRELEARVTKIKASS